VRERHSACRGRDATFPFSQGSARAVNRTGARDRPARPVRDEQHDRAAPTATQAPPGSFQSGGTSCPEGGAGSSKPFAAAARRRRARLSSGRRPSRREWAPVRHPRPRPPLRQAARNTPGACPESARRADPRSAQSVEEPYPTMPGLRSVETCTSAGPCGALDLLHAASSAARTATQSGFMAAQSGCPDRIVNDASSRASAAGPALTLVRARC